MSKDRATQIVIEPRAGGRFYERVPDGSESDFGSVITYDPPRHLAYHWYLGTGSVQPQVKQAVDYDSAVVPGVKILHITRRSS